ncbi:Flavone 3'-O-methyltransferase 1 [Citrus sinensis]|uniref:Flavone 3'-O-methyltransferase 1 n=1 Tax=Citrus sinensis TaxID=2711 RepID=A0ACB8MD62_CITSI|nr:Flavone 3'-O-methyltransferase 1 [Citrus sinensis]
MPSHNPNAAVMLELDRVLRLLVIHTVCFVALFHQLVMTAGYNVLHLWPNTCFVLNQDGVYSVPSWPWLETKPYEIHGDYEHAGLDSRFNEVLNTAMLSHNSIVMNRILDYYKGFEKIKQLVDVGGGCGKCGWKMFQKILNGDAILMKLILRNWDDEHCLSLLKNCYEAIPGNGKIIIIDSTTMVIPEATPATREASSIDIIMLMQLSGEKKRTKQEYYGMALTAKNGFKGVNYESFVCNFYIMEFIK